MWGDLATSFSSLLKSTLTLAHVLLKVVGRKIFFLSKKLKCIITYLRSSQFSMEVEIQSLSSVLWRYVVSGGSRGRNRCAPPPLTVPTLSFRHINFTKRRRVRSWRPLPPRGWRPLRAILDPPLAVYCRNRYETTSWNKNILKVLKLCM